MKIIRLQSSTPFHTIVIHFDTISKKMCAVVKTFIPYISVHTMESTVVTNVTSFFLTNTAMWQISGKWTLVCCVCKILLGALTVSYKSTSHTTRVHTKCQQSWNPFSSEDLQYSSVSQPFSFLLSSQNLTAHNCPKWVTCFMNMNALLGVEFSENTFWLHLVFLWMSVHPQDLRKVVRGPWILSILTLKIQHASVQCRRPAHLVRTSSKGRRKAHADLLFIMGVKQYFGFIPKLWRDNLNWQAATTE